MRHLLVPRTGLFAAALLLFLAPAAFGTTTALLAKRDGKWLPVAKVRGNVPMVSDGEKLVPAESEKYALLPVDHYRKGMRPPVIVQVDQMKMGTWGLELMGEGSVINNELNLTADITSPVTLHNVFAVFELQGGRVDRTLFIREVGELPAGERTRFEYHTPLAAEIGAFRYILHLYAGGFELLYPGQGWGHINQDIGQRVRAETEGVENESPRPYVVTPPVLPDSVKKRGAGQIVKVRATILPDGSVPDARAEPGTPADLAMAAETSVKCSYFLPLIRHGRAEECKVLIPVVLGDEPKR